MKGIYFEEKGLQLLGNLGITKAEFARRMGIQRQNVNALFKSNNLEIIARAADVLDVPLALLVGYVEEPDVYELPNSKEDDEKWSTDEVEILPEDVPMGDTPEERRKRQEIIKQFYFNWKMRNPDLCKYNAETDAEEVYALNTSNWSTTLIVDGVDVQTASVGEGYYKVKNIETGVSSLYNSKNEVILKVYGDMHLYEADSVAYVTVNVDGEYLLYVINTTK